MGNEKEHTMEAPLFRKYLARSLGSYDNTTSGLGGTGRRLDIVWEHIFFVDTSLTR